ncbi:hypothetical protein J8I29_07275 [Labrys sp. LIt4]|uniref:Uncharacterized protein n=1 Tax=Labrys okinawensis TaxID=346911 RepID=A0A2S9Q551_9HYPH|nr:MULTISPECIES: hypothetical protein [Labrys]MBP0579100.1 hypothetical protein [Labrys sp. LIt4]PRH84476.1 hypothetical protein C5L14_26875 [Labrys okinawensis]
MSITSLLDCLFGRKASFPASAKEQASPLPKIHIVALAPSGATDALAKALESAHFTEIKG